MATKTPPGTEHIERFLEFVGSAIKQVLETVERLLTPNDRKTIPADEATLIGLAKAPRASVTLTAEQRAIAQQIEAQARPRHARQ